MDWIKANWIDGFRKWKGSTEPDLEPIGHSWYQRSPQALLEKSNGHLSLLFEAVVRLQVFFKSLLGLLQVTQSCTRGPRVPNANQVSEASKELSLNQGELDRWIRKWNRADLEHIGHSWYQTLATLRRWRPTPPPASPPPPLGMYKENCRPSTLNYSHKFKSDRWGQWLRYPCRRPCSCTNPTSTRTSNGSYNVASFNPLFLVYIRKSAGHLPYLDPQNPRSDRW